MSDRRNLFRSQAVRYKSTGQHGTSLIYQPLVLKVATLILVVFFPVLIVTISFAHYKTTVAVRGSLSPSAGTVAVYANSSGHLQEILVSEGQTVTRGAVLAVVSNSQYDSDGIAMNQLGLAQMQAEQASLQEQLRLSRRLQVEVESQHETAMAGLVDTIELVTQELLLINDQLQLSDDNLQAQAAVLDQQGISRLQYNQHQANHIGLLQQSQDLQIRIHTLKNQLKEMQAQDSSTALTYRLEQLRIGSQIEQLDYRYRQLGSAQNETLIASTAGVVTAITAVPGQSSDPRRPLMYINTASASVVATLYVPSSAIGNIALEQSVLIEYDAYSQQSYGSYSATIDSISQTSVDPRQHLFPIGNLQEPVYLATATLQQQHVSGPEVHQVQPGMLLTADIVTDDLTLWQHIFNPLIRLKRKT